MAGRIEPGSSLAENLKREVKEETGLELAGEVILVAAQDILRVPNKHVVRLTYIGRANGEPVLDFENTNFGWFTAEKIYSMKDELDQYLEELVEEGVLLS